jgi:hypothetical protein
MANEVQDIQRKRFDYLKRLYDITEGSEHADVMYLELGAELGLTRPEIDKIYEYLIGEGLIVLVLLAGSIGITHKGIVEVETALSKPDEPTKYLPPVNNIHIDKMIGSQIQHGTHQSSQNMRYSKKDLEAILRIISELKEQLIDLKISSDKKAEVYSEIVTIESQAKSPHSKHTIIKAALDSILNILEEAAGSAIGELLSQKIAALIK